MNMGDIVIIVMKIDSGYSFEKELVKIYLYKSLNDIKPNFQSSWFMSRLCI